MKANIRHNSILAAIIGLFLCVAAGAKASDGGETLTMEYAYCSDVIASQGVGDMGKSLYFKAAIQIPAEKAQAYAGNSITEVKVGTTRQVGRHAKVFLTYELGGEPFYTQDITLERSRWNVVKLSTPYVIEGREFFIGYSADTTGSYKKTYLPIAIDNSAKASEYGDWVSVKTEADAADSWEHLGASGFSNVSIKATVEGTTLPRHDVALTELSLRKFTKPGADFAISGTVKNMAALPFSRLGVSYTVGSQTGTAEIASDSEIASKGEFSFSVPNVKISEEGVYDVTLTVTSIDGYADEHADDNSASAQVKCTSKLFDKKVLLENFTTESCSNCPRVHEYVSSIMKDDNRVVCVAHHAGFGTDEFTISASKSYLWFYDSNSTYAPAIMLDRTNFTQYGIESATPVFNPTSENYLRNLLKFKEDEPGFFDISAATTYDAATRQLTIGVKSAVSEEYEGDKNLFVTVFLTEDGLHGKQSGAGNDYIHDHAIRALLTNIKGDNADFSVNGTFEKTFTTTLDAAWKPENMHVVAFVNEFDTGDVNGCEVYNVCQTDVMSGETAIKGNRLDGVSVGTDGATVVVGGQFDSVEAYTLDGRRTVSTGEARFSLPAGVYVVKVKHGGDVKTQKVVVGK